jgi:hypothetical protein
MASLVGGSYNLLNVLVWIANKMGLQKKKNNSDTGAVI